ncbi:MAG: DUF4381 domain-containing protein [Gammaproteobacteria bacterium]|nr:DUF4381 domain-containing protein [Gammaproteobacteria bacterium]
MAQMPNIMQPTNPDPLAELKDIHLPPAIDSFLLAPGWWIMMLLALGLAGLLIWQLKRRHQKSRYRRQAIAALKENLAHYESRGDASQFLMDYNSILKRVALVTWPRTHVASLTGEAWVGFLDQTLGDHSFAMGPGQILIEGPYQSEILLNSKKAAWLTDLGARWVRAHKSLPVTEDSPSPNPLAGVTP